MEALVEGVLSILATDPTLGVIVLGALGFGGYKWLDKRKPDNGGKGLNGEAKQIYDKLDAYNDKLLSVRTDVAVLAERSKNRRQSDGRA